MYKRGVNSKPWKIVKELNENLTATIHTKYRPTRKITIKDSIRRHGGVLSVLLYALLMDEINKEIQEIHLGIEISDTPTKMAYLLWMDDVLLLETKPKEKQKLLDITEKLAEKYHIKFGKEKSQSLTIGKTNKQPQFTLGQMQVEPTEKYKYLWEMVNKKLSLKDQLKQVEGKVEAADQALLVKAEDRHFKNIHMETFWKIVSACIIPIITYAGETRKPTKENKNLSQLLDRIIRKILMVPESTPREVLYIKSGLLDIETITVKNRIMMGERIKKDGSQLLNKVTKIQYLEDGRKSSERQKKNMMSLTKTSKKRIHHQEKYQQKITATFKRITERNGENKSKINYLLEGNEGWTPGQPKSYMPRLGKTQASTIFKARTIMLHVKITTKMPTQI